MRTITNLVAACVLMAAVPASGQVTPPTVSGAADVTVGATDITGDPAGWQKYRDLREGGAVESLRLDWRGPSWRFETSGAHLGRRDQQFGAEFMSARIKAAFQWNQVPLFRSVDTRTPFRTEATGVLRLDDAMQRGLETGALTLRDVANTASFFETRSRRHTGTMNLSFIPARGVGVNLNMQQTDRQGNQPFGASFAFNNVVEVAAPIDSRTRDLRADLEWTGKRGMMRVGYDGSWFQNDVHVLTWDNPLKLNDVVSATGYVDGRAGSQGQLALWPDSTMHGVSTSGALKLPAKTRVTASLRTGIMRQDQELLPTTVNTAAGPAVMSRDSAEVDARTLAMTYSVTSRPLGALWLNARYRYDEVDNRTPTFSVSEWLVMDQTAHAGVQTHPLGYVRQTIDVDASIAAGRAASLRAGYTRAMNDLHHRIYERTVEDAYRASIDAVANQYVTVRAIVERAERRGTGFDQAALTEVGEQPALRHYDVADRDRQRVTAQAQITPHKLVAFSASASVGKDTYGASGFGLRDNDNRVYTFTFDVTPTAKTAFYASYTRERYTAQQWSRTANPGPQQLDPTRDWSIDADDEVETISAGVDLLKWIPRTEVRLTYDLSNAKAAYLYGRTGDSTLLPFVQLPSLRNEWLRATGDVRFFVTPKVAIGAIYWYDDYIVEDFGRDEAAVGSLVRTGSLFLGSVYRPYTATAASLRILWLW